MTIPTGVLDNWTNYESAAIESARSTHTRIRNCLENSSALTDIDFETFLQGSYANTTLVRGSGDVDIVVKLEQSWQSDLSRLDLDEKREYGDNVSSATYSWDRFKSDVVDVLETNYGSESIELGDKAIEVDTDSLPIGADVVVCIEFRQYVSIDEYPGNYIEGIVFWNESTDERIENFPMAHRRNGEAKQEETNGRYKETVRLFKNARNKLVERDWIEKEEVPSYFVECLLYNVPPGLYVNDLTERYEQIVGHLQGATIENYRCQNEIHELFGPEPTQWTIDNAEKFISQLQGLYSEY